MAELKAGDKAPDFTLPGNGGSTVRLSDHAGQAVVLYFYPKDDTPGCTIEAKDFTSMKAEFEKAGAVVIGMSPDSAKSHDKFVKKHELTITLAADEEKNVLDAYGVWKEKSMYGKTYMGVERTTVLIGKDGRIARIWNKVSVAGHVDEVLAAVKAL